MGSKSKTKANKDLSRFQKKTSILEGHEARNESRNEVIYYLKKVNLLHT